MNYEDFLSELTAEIQWNFPEYRIEFEKTTVNKANETLDGLVVRFPGQISAATFYPEKLYENYLNGASISRIAGNVSESLSAASDGYPEIPELTPENAAKCISFSLLNKEKNQNLLKECPYKNIHDLAAVPRWHMGNGASFIVNNSVAQALCLTKEEILDIAQKNTEAAEYSCRGINDIMKQMLAEEGIDDAVADEILPFAQSPFHVITNKDCADGSCAVLSGNFMQKTAEHLGCQELYLLPSSRHEMIVVNAGNHADSAELKKIVEEVNSMTDTVSEKDFLSNSIYKYDAKTHSLSMCDSRGLFHNKSNTKDAVKQSASKGRGGL